MFDETGYQRADMIVPGAAGGQIRVFVRLGSVCHSFSATPLSACVAYLLKRLFDAFL